MSDSDASHKPYELPETHKVLGKLQAECWLATGSGQILRMVGIVLLALGPISLPVGLYMHLGAEVRPAGAIIAVLGLVGTLGGWACFADSKDKIPHVVGVYKRGVVEARPNGIRYQIPWDDVEVVGVQEFYASRFADMVLLVDVTISRRKHIKFESTHLGDPIRVLKVLKKRCAVFYETWDEVLARTG